MRSKAATVELSVSACAGGAVLGAGRVYPISDWKANGLGDQG